MSTKEIHTRILITALFVKTEHKQKQTNWKEPK